MGKKLLIFGTGTLGEIAHFYFCEDSDYEVVGFADIDERIPQSGRLLGKPAIRWSDARTEYDPEAYEIFVAIGYRKSNSIRESRYLEAKAAGYRCATYISSRATVFTDNIGDNCLILENNVIQPFTVVGNNVTMWSGNHLGHHSVIEDNVFVASHAVISGRCRIGANSFLGVNCCLHDGVSIGPKTVVGAGAIVTQSSGPRSVFKPQGTEMRIIGRDII